MEQLVGAALWPVTGTQKPAEKMPCLCSPEPDPFQEVWKARRPWMEQRPRKGSDLCDSGKASTVPGPSVLSECAPSPELEGA